MLVLLRKHTQRPHLTTTIVGSKWFNILYWEKKSAEVNMAVSIQMYPVNGSGTFGKYNNKIHKPRPMYILVKKVPINLLPMILLILNIQ